MKGLAKLRRMNSPWWMPRWVLAQQARNAEYLSGLDKVLSLSEPTPSSPTSETPSKDEP